MSTPRPREGCRGELGEPDPQLGELGLGLGYFSEEPGSGRGLGLGLARVRVIVRVRVGCPLSWPQGPRLKAGARHRAMQSGVECGERERGGGWAGCVADGRGSGAVVREQSHRRVSGRLTQAILLGAVGSKLVQQARAACARPAPISLARAQSYLGRPICREDDRRHSATTI